MDYIDPDVLCPQKANKLNLSLCSQGYRFGMHYHFLLNNKSANIVLCFHRKILQTIVVLISVCSSWRSWYPCHLHPDPSDFTKWPLLWQIAQTNADLSTGGDTELNGMPFNTLRLRQNCRNLSDNSFRCVFLSEDLWILLKISLKCVSEIWINNIPVLVQIMAWRQSGNKPVSKPMMVSLLMHICITWPQWIKIHMFSFNKML